MDKLVEATIAFNQELYRVLQLQRTVPIQLDNAVRSVQKATNALRNVLATSSLQETLEEITPSQVVRAKSSPSIPPREVASMVTPEVLEIRQNRSSEEPPMGFFIKCSGLIRERKRLWLACVELSRLFRKNPKGELLKALNSQANKIVRDAHLAGTIMNEEAKALSITLSPLWLKDRSEESVLMVLAQLLSPSKAVEVQRRMKQ